MTRSRRASRLATGFAKPRKWRAAAGAVGRRWRRRAAKIQPSCPMPWSRRGSLRRRCDVAPEGHVRRRSVYADRLLEFPDIVFSDGRQFSKRGRWREHFGLDKLIFEIGCNDAGLLASVAAKHPSVAFLGIDWKCRALHDAASRVDAAGLRNVALLHGRAQEIRKFFADSEIDEVWVFHPDPCDKPDELPNRLLAEPFLLDVHQVLRDTESALILKTDHREYFEWVHREL